ncbi:hypothetical protein MKZ38_006629 [Zalerion maritima]|uniref:Rhodopsin domain-containing protein n=1 Tax=Zalerion maritima TaxID=339359 RepID=A0AAD5WND0_9PEZI|nr:hypothetical protein MKZ38_006629 [Zalerion maritima]
MGQQLQILQRRGGGGPIDPTGGYAILAVLLGLSWIFFSLRMYVRIVMLRKPGWDDLLVFLSLVSYTIFTGFACGLVANGLGEDIDESAEDAEKFSRGSFYFLFSELFFIVGSTLLRIACAMMLLRIMLKKDKMLRYVIYGSVGLMMAYSIAFFFLTLFQCRPVSYFWTFMLESGADGHENGLTADHSGGTCINGNTVTGDYTTMSTLFVIYSLVSLICDWTLGSVPFLMLRGVQMTVRKKIIVMALLSLGILAGVAALVRCPLIIIANHKEFWDSAIPVAVTTAIEPALGIIGICAATLMPLVRRGILRRLDSREGKQPHSGRSHHMSSLGKNGAATNSRSQNSRSGHHGISANRDREHSDTAIVIHTTWMIEEDSDDGNSSHKGEGDDGPHQGLRHHVAMAV